MYQKIRMPLICGFAAVASVIMAMTNENGLIIQDSIELDPFGACLFYWVSAAAFTLIFAFTMPRFWITSSAASAKS